VSDDTAALGADILAWVEGMARRESEVAASPGGAHWNGMRAKADCDLKKLEERALELPAGEGVADGLRAARREVNAPGDPVRVLRDALGTARRAAAAAAR
jgi:hypothetical protein